jgi:hypothetical protein
LQSRTTQARTLGAGSQSKPLGLPPGWKLRLLASQYHEFDCTRRANGGESDAGWEGARQWLHFQELAKARPALMKKVKRKEK